MFGYPQFLKMKFFYDSQLKNMEGNTSDFKDIQSEEQASQKCGEQIQIAETQHSISPHQLIVKAIAPKFISSLNKAIIKSIVENVKPRELQLTKTKSLILKRRQKMEEFHSASIRPQYKKKTDFGQIGRKKSKAYSALKEKSNEDGELIIKGIWCKGILQRTFSQQKILNKVLN